MPGGRVLLGHVARAHGIRGALRVRPASGRPADTARSLRALPALYLGDERFALRAVRPEREDLLVELEGVADRDRAEALRGRTVEVERAQLPPPAEDELYLADLVGCEVVEPGGARIGTVRGSFEAGAQETLIVDGAHGEVLLPWVPGLVVSVDLPGRRVVYAPPPGLLDDAPDDDDGG